MMMCLAARHTCAQAIKTTVKTLPAVNKAALRASQRAVTTRIIMAERQANSYRYAISPHKDLHMHIHHVPTTESLKYNKPKNVTRTNVMVNNTVSEKAHLSEDKETSTYEYIIYGGIALIIILFLGFIPFIIYDKYYRPVEKKNHTSISTIHPKADKPRIWYVNPTGEVRLSL